MGQNPVLLLLQRLSGSDCAQSCQDLFSRSWSTYRRNNIRAALPWFLIIRFSNARCFGFAFEGDSCDGVVVLGRGWIRGRTAFSPTFVSSPLRVAASTYLSADLHLLECAIRLIRTSWRSTVASKGNLLTLMLPNGRPNSLNNYEQNKIESAIALIPWRLQLKSSGLLLSSTWAFCRRRSAFFRLQTQFEKLPVFWILISRFKIILVTFICLFRESSFDEQGSEVPDLHQVLCRIVEIPPD